MLYPAKSMIKILNITNKIFFNHISKHSKNAKIKNPL